MQDIETPIEIIHAEDLCQVVGDLPHLAMARAGRQVAAKANTQKASTMKTLQKRPSLAPTLRKAPSRSLRAVDRQDSVASSLYKALPPITHDMLDVTPLEPSLAQKHPFRFDLHVRRHGLASSVLSFSAESKEQAQTWSMLLYTFLSDAKLFEPDTIQRKSI